MNNNLTIKGMKAPELRMLFEETIDDINKIKTALENIEEQKKQALDSNLEISGNENKEGILAEIKKYQREANEKIELIRQLYDELFGQEDNENDIGLKGKMDEVLKEFYSTQEKFKIAENNLYWYDKKLENGEEKHIDGLVEKIENFFEIQKKKYLEKYIEIEEKLLPGATTVGLASAYVDKSDSYKLSNIFWLIGFFISIGGIIYVLSMSLSDLKDIFLIKSSDNSKDEILKIVNTENILEYLIFKFIVNIGIISSLVWIATFTSKRYGQNKRLAEEYSYKATFAKSFEGYRKKAEELDEINDNKDLSNSLMEKMIEMTSFNPVETMESKSHQEDYPTKKIMEKSLDVISNSIEIINKKIT